MSGPTVGYATLQIVPSAKGFAAALRGETDSEIDDAGRAGGGVFGNAFKVAATAAIGAAAAGLGLAIKGTFAAIDFDQQMREVFTLLPGISGDAMSEMTDQVKGFAVEFGVLPQDVVPALYQSISAGVPTDNVFAFLETAQMAARGGVTELSTAVDGISSVVNAYGADMISAAEASDLMFTAVRLGKTDFSQLSASLFNVTPTASALGVEFGDVTAALAALTAQGVPTSVATTQMRQLFIELSKEGGKAATTFEEMAGQSFSEFIAAGGNTADALDLMLAASAELGVGVNDLFSSVEAGSAALSLAGSDVFVANLAEMEGASGATQAAFDVMNQGLRPVIDRFKAWGQVMLIEIGERVIPIIEKAVEFVQQHWPTISAVISQVMAEVRKPIEAAVAWVQANWPTIQQVIRSTVDVIVSVLSTLGDAFRAGFGWLIDNRPVLIGIAAGVGAVLVAMFTGWAISAGAAAVATIAAASPFIALAAAVAAVVAAVIVAYQEWEWFRTAVDAVRDWMVGTLWPAIQNVFNWLKDNVPPILQRIADFFTDTVVPAMTTAWEFVRDNVIPVLTQLATYIGAGFKVGMDLAKTLFDTLKTAATAVWNFVRDNVIPILTTLATYIAAGFKVGMDLAKTLFDAARTAVETLWQWVQTLWDRLEPFRAFVAGAFKIGLEVAETVFGAVRTAIESVWEWAQTVWDRLELFRSFVAGVFRLGLDAAVVVFGAIRASIETVWNWVQTAWDRLEPFREFMDGAFKLAMGVAKTAVDGVADAFWRIVGAVRSAVEWIDKLPRSLPSWVMGGSTDPTKNPAFARNARGTSMYGGGVTWVGEEGPELVRLPSGSRVWSTQESAAMAGPSAATGPAQFPDPDAWAREAARALRGYVRMDGRAA